MFAFRVGKEMDDTIFSVHTYGSRRTKASGCLPSMLCSTGLVELGLGLTESSGWLGIL